MGRWLRAGGVRHPVLTAIKVLISETNPNAERSRILTRKDWKLKLMVTVGPALWVVCVGWVWVGVGGFGDTRVHDVLCVIDWAKTTKVEDEEGWGRERRRRRGGDDEVRRRKPNSTVVMSERGFVQGQA